MRQVKKTGLSRESYIRALIMNRQPKEQPPADYLSVLKELRGIGRNMNQIALKANAIGFINASAYWDECKELEKAIGKLMEEVYS